MINKNMLIGREVFKMKIKGICMVGLLAILICSYSSFAQTEKEPKDSKTRDRVPTIEELYLKDSNLLLINQYALSTDSEQKLRGLQEIEKLIKANELKENDETILRILNYLSKEGVRHEVIQGTTIVNYFPLVRKKASELLGLLGKATNKKEVAIQAKEALIEILMSDIEPMVKSEAVFSLGTIGINQNGDVVKAIDYTLTSQSVVNPDNNFAYAIILALEKIADANQGIKDWEAYSTLVKISQGNFNRMVRDKALAAIEHLKKYQK